MVDLRYEIEEILREYGSYALLIKTAKTKPCKCVDSLSQAAKDKCPVCLGTGYLHEAERVLMRSRATASSDTLPKIVNLAEIGNIGVALRQFYLKHNIRPQNQDLLVLCEWNGLIPMMDEYTEIYEINYAEPLRGDGGRIEFFLVVAKSDPINMKIRFDNIRNNVEKNIYYVAASR